MDCYSLNSEGAETLNFLRPPVQRSSRNFSSEKACVPDCSSHHNNVQLVKDYRTKVTKGIQRPVVDRTTVTSSTSLVLKKTTEREISEQYSVLRYNTDLQHLNQNFGQTAISNLKRPLIKVTVIPNNTSQTQTTKFRKRRHATNRVQNTVSNQENSIKAKNIYLVVAGRQKEKIYEIKTTSSADFSNQIYVNDDHEGAEQVTGFQHLISSLNMDKKKKKGKKKESVHEVSRSSLVNEVLEGADLPIAGYSKYVRPRKSRVRITGRIGMTEDDRYVLRCDASVNDKPIPTNFSPLSQGVFKNNDQRSSNSRDVKDCNIQADFEVENIFNTYKRAKSYRTEVQDKESQGTQTNLNTLCFSNIETLKIFSQNEHTMCTCKKANKNMSEMENYFDSPNTSSPLVIISVYPKQETMETSKDEKSASKDNRSRSPNNAKLKPRGGKHTVENSVNKSDKSLRTRSPSPSTRSPPKSRIENNQMETRTLRAKITRETINQGTANYFNKPKLPNDRLYQDTRTKSSERNTPQTRSPANRNQKNMNATALKLQESGTNTDYTLTKKALVDTYTKKISDHMNQNRRKQREPEKKTDAKDEVSNVTINVEAENEFYDFIFHQGDLTTDMRFRKTVKDQGSQKDHTIHANMSPSLENFLLLSENGGQRKRSFSQTFLFGEQSYDDIAQLRKPLSRVNLRDSLEISHRREQRNSVGASGMKPQFNNSNDSLNENGNSKNFAPIKHYRGDNCSILDPVQRDKEIRELLGVDKHKPTTSKPEESNDNYLIEDHSSVHCFYQVNKQQTVAPAKGSSSLCSLYECSMHECPCEDETESDQKKTTFKEPSRIKETTSDSSPERTPEPSKDSEPSPEESSEQPPNQTPKQTSKQLRASTTAPPQHPLYQQLILNRNVNVYLQIEQFTKQKPILLSRKQYDKVKRTIESNSAKTAKSPCICKKYSSLTLGEVRRKSNKKETLLKKEVSRKLKQDDVKPDERKSLKSKKNDNKKTEKGKNVICQCGDGDAAICECGKQKNVICDSRCLKRGADHNNIHSGSRHKSKHTDQITNCTNCGKEQSEGNNYCCFCGMKNEGQPGKGKACKCVKSNPSARHASSSVEIRYTSVAYMKRVTFSSTAVETSIPLSTTETKPENNVHNTDSIFTIFKGHRKTPTPNLGTSVYSLPSDYSAGETSRVMSPRDPKPRRPFLRRLMSCLVMRSTNESQSKLDKRAVPRLASVNSSIDSYHISTSLGAIELTSSIYDTSDSFYSNHSIMPVSSKMKRGFLSSVRGFLTSRRS